MAVLVAALVVVAAGVMAMAVVVVVVVVLAVVMLSLRMIPCYQKPHFLRLLKRCDGGTGRWMDGWTNGRTDPLVEDASKDMTDMVSKKCEHRFSNY